MLDWKLNFVVVLGFRRNFRMSDTSLSSSRSGFASGRSSKTKTSMANVSRRRRGGRKSRTSFSSRSRFNVKDSSSSKNNNYHKVIIDGEDVTPNSLLPPMNADGAAATQDAGQGKSAPNPSNAKVTSSLLQVQHSDSGPPVAGGLRVQAATSPASTGNRPRLTAAQLDQDVVITLTETNTMELFHLRGYVVHQESDQHRVVSAQNESYQGLFEKRKNKDLFSTASAQTMNRSSKNKKTQAEPPLTRDVEVTATNWDIFDSQQNKNELEDWQTGPKDKDDDGGDLAEGVKDLVTMCLATPGSLLSVAPGEATNKAQVAGSGLDAGRQALQEQAANRILSSSALNDQLRLVERIIQQEHYHTKQLAYHDLPPVISPDVNVVANVSTKVADEESKAPVGVVLPTAQSDEALVVETDTAAEEETKDESLASAAIATSNDSRLELQWSFQCEMTKGRNVSSMVWNPKNPNLLAVSYGSFDFVDADAESKGQDDGMILFWSLKNPEYPERAISLPSGVTSIDFSSTRPYILAAGLYDGTIAIFDTRLPTDKPIFESNMESGKHSDTVWQVKWIVRGGDHQTESLVSLSTDGRVKEWFMKKGLSHIDLMTLKRVPNQTGPQWRPVNSKGEGVISRLGNGLCFSFPTTNTDTVIYFVGTEDGVIHKCSSSYNEQYLGSYHGHTGPVYKIKCHPIDPNVFLSCSADWAVKLWSADRENDSELTFHQMDLNDVVHDVEWAPHNATVFASVTADGRIEVWDIQNSALVPTICHRVEEVVDEVALAQAQELARLEQAKKKKKKKQAEYEFDEFGDDEDIMNKKSSKEDKESKEPEIEVAMRPKKLSCVRFADGAQIIVTGDDTGAVDVYKIFGLTLNDALHQNKPKELDILHHVMRPERNNLADL